MRPVQHSPRAYYDEFADWYERERGRAYHRMIDDLEVAAVAPLARGAHILEVGCGTGLILARTARLARRATGLDLSAHMLARAAARGLSVLQGSATALPFADRSFDLVYAFKVLPHVADIRAALSEMARVTRPGGHVVAELYNPRSLRHLIKRLKPPSQISATTTDRQVYTRYDTVARARTYLPPDLQVRDIRAIRVLTPTAALHDLPILGPLLRTAEARLATAPLTRHLGGFTLLITRKH